MSYQALAGEPAIATEVARIDSKLLIDEVRFSPDGHQLAIQDWTDTAVWEWSQKRAAFHIQKGHLGDWTHQHVSFSPDGQFVAVCHDYVDIVKPREQDQNFSSEIYALQGGTVIAPLGKEGVAGAGCRAIAFSPHEGLLARLTFGGAAKAGSNVVLYSTATAKPSTTWQPTGGFKILPDYVHRPGVDVQVEQPPSGSHSGAPVDLQLFPDSSGLSFSPAILAFSPDGKRLAVHGTLISADNSPFATDYAIAIIDLATQSITQTILDKGIKNNGFVVDIAWSADGTRIAVADPDAIRIFDVKTGGRVLEQHFEPAHSHVIYTPDDRYLIEAYGTRVEIWDSAHSKLLQTLRAAPSCMDVSPDGHFLALGGGRPDVLSSNVWLDLVFRGGADPGRAIIFRLR